ncbi:MAG: HlyD family type I secretion periplasmic adaptor subunit [Burkholderiales bacterium]|uniref:HlyD family type I secretion periplasmic adaptor subunit n=1 Tax=Inhella sp. TaxID=1921806 RepID=UPI001AC451B3|nr:HlyD family type I secretion periplasmic adaptor subunit [Burkholderiales bacterium]
MSATTATNGAAQQQQPQPHPVKELLQRYAAIFKAAWEHRDELAGPKRLAHEQAFLPAAMALQETPPHPAPRRFMLAICALFVIALVWSLVGKLDIVAVAQGRIVVSDRTKIIQPLETASVKAIHVKDGDRVGAGQLLIELDATQQGADLSRVGQERDAASSEQVRTQALLQALSEGKAPKLGSGDATIQAQLQAEWSDIQAKQARLQAEGARRQAELVTAEHVVAKLKTMLPLAQAREQDYQNLANQGFVAGHATQDRARERIELERDLATAQARLAEVQATVVEARQQASSYRAELLRALSERQAQARLKVAQLGEEATKAGQRQTLTRLTAPVAGTVQQLAVHTAGGVVTPAQALLVIVPNEAEVTAEVQLENKDIGFVKVGQQAEVKLETFPFTRYGTVPATVTRISADAVQDEKRGALYVATLKLDKTLLAVEGQRVALSPGMNLTAEVKMGKRRVIEYLISPIEKHAREGMRER